MDVGDAAGNPMIRNALGDSFPASPEVTLRLCREAGIDEYSHVLHLGAGVGLEHGRREGRPVGVGGADGVGRFWCQYSLKKER